jgi:hypothetical protein
MMKYAVVGDEAMESDDGADKEDDPNDDDRDEAMGSDGELVLTIRVLNMLICTTVNGRHQ